MKKILLTLGLIVMGATPALAQIQPSQAKTDEMRSKGPCRDPWISWAYQDASGSGTEAMGFGDFAQCNPKWYNNGSWNNYTELYNAVVEYRNSLYRSGITWQRQSLPDGTIAFFANVDSAKYGAIGKGMKLDGDRLIGTDSAGLVGNDGASLVAAGGGNLVAAGGGNMVAAGSLNQQLLAGAIRRIRVGRNTYMVIRR